MTYLGNFGLEFDFFFFLIFEISALDFVSLPSLVQKEKLLNLRPKVPYLAILELKFEKTLGIFEINTLKFI